MEIDLKNGIFFLSKKRNFYCEINPKNGEIVLCGGQIYLSDKEKNRLITLLDKKTVFRNNKSDLKKLLDIVEKLNE